MSTSEPAKRQVTYCGVCSLKSLKVVWDLPKFPITEAFGEFNPEFPSPDQALVQCESCGHTQLNWQIDPRYLYTPESYVFGSTVAPKVFAEHEYLINFIRRLMPQGHCRVALEFGANNLSFAQGLLELTDQLLVCDPLLPEGPSDSRIDYIRATIEDAMASGLQARPELVVARHTLEHIGDPASVIDALLDAVRAPGMLVFEVPSLDHIKSKLRFDAVTHQHIHYFSLTSVLSLARRTGSHLVDFTYNDRGSNGGSLIFALSKGKANGWSRPDRLADVSSPTLELALAQFKEQMQFFDNVVPWSAEDTFGFGASLMLATLDYHLGGRISQLDFVFDDDEARHGSTYSNVNVSVLSTQTDRFPETGTFFVTSFENTRAIYTRLRDLGVARIFAPVVS